MSVQVLAALLTLCVTACAVGSDALSDNVNEEQRVPGVVIHHIAGAKERFVGSPGIARLAEGVYLAKCDEFGPGSSEWNAAVTHVFRSEDAGESWKRVASVEGLFWASIFTHNDAVYLMGTHKHHGNVVILRSQDQGRTWTNPTGPRSGLILEGAYHTAPMPVLVHNGRLWRAMEDASLGNRWGSRYGTFMMSAPVEADLLNRDSWVSSNVLARDGKWLNSAFGGWLEGNAVATRDGRLVNVLRAHVGSPGSPWEGYRGDGVAAVVQVSDDGETVTFDPQEGFIRFPGGATKFTIRYDPQSQAYWSLTNFVPEQHRGQVRYYERIRNTLVLTRSTNLRDWEIRSVVLYHPDPADHGFQYVDWLFEGDDLVAVSRTAYDDGQGGARAAHDANYLTFHRIRNFRALTLEDSVGPANLIRNSGTHE